MQNLPAILNAVQHHSTNWEKDTLIANVGRNAFIPKLFDLFEQSEDLADTESLKTLFNIFRSLILLNDHSTMETLLSEANIMRLMGALECKKVIIRSCTPVIPSTHHSPTPSFLLSDDPDLPSKQNHREFLEKKAKFRTVVNFRNKALLSKIHQTYRIQYLKVMIKLKPNADRDSVIVDTLFSYVFHFLQSLPFQL
jgi:protein phosphatase-4 regulatory subunit 3